VIKDLEADGPGLPLEYGEEVAQIEGEGSPASFQHWVLDEKPWVVVVSRGLSGEGLIGECLEWPRLDSVKAL
jgi:hypothetical protein